MELPPLKYNRDPTYWQLFIARNESSLTQRQKATIRKRIQRLKHEKEQLIKEATKQ